LGFEAGSSIVKIDSEAFSGCDKVTSLILPASLEVVSASSLSGLTSLESLAFEPGSKLTKLEAHALYGCRSLKSIFLPASLSTITSQAFNGSSIHNIIVDEANAHFSVSGGFLMTKARTTIVRCFADSENVIVGRDIESLGECCFAEAKLINVRFEEDSRLTTIGDFAFRNCTALRSICIPANVERIGMDCFLECKALTECTFAPFSRLTEIGARAFQESGIVSIRIPPKVRELPTHCFAMCNSLEELAFESGSELRHIDQVALSECFHLRSLTIPAQLEFMETELLRCCRDFSEFVFEPGSHLRTISIPDSVESLWGFPLSRRPRSCQFKFGPGSRLEEIDLNWWNMIWTLFRHPSKGNTAFVRLSEGALRRFRSDINLIAYLTD
jgi:hypothetical protein